MTRTVAVVGGGPAGLMAAEVLATAGSTTASDELRVVVFDRMRSVGRKFQLAGRGGLNLTHTEPLDRLLERYGPARSALAPAIEAFTPTDVRAWTTGLGQRAVVGTSGRVFPEAFRATPLLRAWLGRLQGLGVDIRTGHDWLGWTDDGALHFDGPAVRPVRADATVLALGGASWPRTGSNGAWVPVLQGAGVEVAPLQPANSGVRVRWTEHFRTRFAGTPLKGVRVRCGDDVAKGDVMVTATGVEGGAVYAVGRALRTALASAPAATAKLHVDLRPEVSAGDLAERLTQRRRPKDSRSTTLRRAAGLTPTAIGLLREFGPLPDDDRELARRIKDVRLTVAATESIDRAISTAGGIALHEVDERFMLRRRPGTFVAGEMLDWDAPTGGYLLQATFSTAVAAAHGALAWLRTL